MEIKQLVNNQTHVSITLSNHLFSKKCPNTNVVFCPLSIHVALSLIATGSKGRTLEQLLTFLKSDTVHDLNTLTSHLLSLMADGNSSGGPRLSSANGVWVEQTLHLKASFKHVLDDVYNATCKQVDFRTKSAEIVNEVNLWAENQTSGIIKNILTTDAVDSSTKLIFANAVYFKGVWKEKFNPLNTKYLDFNLLDGSKVKVPFMTSNEEQLVREYDGFKVLGLPYSQGEDRRRFTMYLYLPNEKDGLQYLIEKMGSESNFLDNYMPHYKREVGQLLIPRFRIPFEFVASDMLKELGLVLPFTGGEGLTEMVDPSLGEKLYVSGIYHKSFVEVNEEGTEAAAVTVNVMIPQCLMRVVRVDFIADHPFLFVIKEDTSGAVLFMGQVTDPRVA